MVSVKTLEQEVIHFAEKHREELLHPVERAEKDGENTADGRTVLPEKSFRIQARQIVPFLLIMLYLTTFTFTFVEILILVLMAGVFITFAQYFRSGMFPCKLTWKQ